MLLFVICFSIAVIFLGLHFMYVGIEEKNYFVFYEGFVMLILAITFLLLGTL